jgi:integrase
MDKFFFVITDERDALAFELFLIWLHKQRDTFASWSLRRKVDLRTIQAWLGHESIEMTARYLATLPDLEQTEKINEAFGGVLATSTSYESVRS